MTTNPDIEWPLVVPPELFGGGPLKLRFPRPERWCVTCQAQGLVSGSLCPHCRGTGLIEEPKELDVVLPAGLHEGCRVPVPDYGIALPHSERLGNLTLVIYPDPRTGTRIVGHDVHIECVLTPLEARTGARRVLRSPAGRITLDIPPQTADGRVLEVRGAGLPGERGYSGSAYVHVRVPASAPPSRPIRDLEAAKAALAGSRYQEAERLLRPIADADPTDGEAHYLVGCALLGRGQARAAIGQLRRALVDGGYATAALHTTTGRAYLRLGLAGLAVWQAALALRERPQSETASKLLGEAVRRFLCDWPESQGWMEEAELGRALAEDARRRYFQTVARAYSELAVRDGTMRLGAWFIASVLNVVDGVVTRQWDHAAEGLAALSTTTTPEPAPAGVQETTGALADYFLTHAPVAARARLAELVAHRGCYAAARSALVACLPDGLDGDGAVSASHVPDLLESARRFRAAAEGAASADAALCACVLLRLADAAERRVSEDPADARFHILADAVRDAWLAVHLAPSDREALRLLADTQDELAGVVAHIVARFGAARYGFFQDTFDALVRGALPFSALSGEAALGLGTRGLMEHFWWAYEAAFSATAPAPGEFLVDAVPNAYVLTSCRLLQANAELGDYDSIPLVNVVDYETVREWRGNIKVIISLRNGGKLEYGWMLPQYAPAPAIVRRFLHEARWRSLPEPLQRELRQGYGGDPTEQVLPPVVAVTSGRELEALPVEEHTFRVAPALTSQGQSLPPNTAGAVDLCTRCRRRLEADWAFCPGCGTATGRQLASNGDRA